MSKFRPAAPILAITSEPRVACKLQLVWGVTPLVTEPQERTSSTFATATNICRERGWLKQGDLVVQTAGTQPEVSGSTDLVKVGIVGSDGLLDSTHHNATI